MFAKLKASLRACAGDVVFGMEDGTVSIFGLVFGVAATTSNPATILIAGCSGAGAAAVSMMAGAFLEAETEADIGAAKASPIARALWMLVSDFFAAIVPIVPFALMPVPEARMASAVLSLLLLAALGYGRGVIGKRDPLITTAGTMGVGVTAAFVGALIGVLLAHLVK